jgi:hypothetical protein
MGREREEDRRVSEREKGIVEKGVEKKEEKGRRRDRLKELGWRRKKWSKWIGTERTYGCGGRSEEEWEG